MLTPRLDEAFRYAHDVHRTQSRKGTRVPYIAHLMDVAAIVLMHGGGEDEAIGALLHDAAEDAGGRDRLADIREGFGPAVAEIVDGCTDTFDTPKPAWLPRKRAFVARVATLPRPVLLVAAADKLSNARSILSDLRNPAIGEAVFDRFTGEKANTLWYYRAMVEAFRQRADAAPMVLVDELDRTVAELQRVAGGAN